MELFLVPALVVWSASGNTGLPGKKLHLRILLGMRIGLKRNNHHKCLISQIQLILRAGFLSTSCTYWAESPQQGGIKSTRGALLTHHGLADTHWPKQKSTMENMSHGKCLQLFLRALQPGSAQPGNNLCHEIFSHSEHIAVQLGDREELCALLNSSEKWQPKPEPSQMVPFSATHGKQTF